jgi:hypothetical protein
MKAHCALHGAMQNIHLYEDISSTGEESTGRVLLRMLVIVDIADNDDEGNLGNVGITTMK